MPEATRRKGRPRSLTLPPAHSTRPLGFYRSRAALEFNTTGVNNTATGVSALASNTTGSTNTANGFVALFGNTTGSINTANGFAALTGNTTGGDNTAVGALALEHNTTGSSNTVLGSGAGRNVTDADNVICIGANVAGFNVSNSCFIGNIRDALVAPDASPVLVDSAGKLGTTSGSSRRFKKAIKPMDKVSEAILALKPVTFQYKSDTTGTPQFGLIAEEVAEVDTDVVVRDKEGKPYSVRYDQVNAMLLNEFLKEHRKVEKQQAIIAELKSTLASQKKNFEVTATKQQKEIEALTVDLQKVSAQVGVNGLGAKVIATEEPTGTSRNDKHESAD
jgi:endosialidase-like protein